MAELASCFNNWNTNQLDKQRGEQKRACILPLPPSIPAAHSWGSLRGQLPCLSLGPPPLTWALCSSSRLAPSVLSAVAWTPWNGEGTPDARQPPSSGRCPGTHWTGRGVGDDPTLGPRGGCAGERERPSRTQAPAPGVALRRVRGGERGGSLLGRGRRPTPRPSRGRARAGGLTRDGGGQAQQRQQEGGQRGPRHDCGC